MLFLVLLACGFTACAAEDTSSPGLGFDFPGSTEFSAELRTTLQTRWDKRSTDYEPRTRTKTEDGRPPAGRAKEGTQGQDDGVCL
jgi:hypothetical protein